MSSACDVRFVCIEGRGGDCCEGPPFIVGDARRVRVPQRRVFGLGRDGLPSIDLSLRLRGL